VLLRKASQLAYDAETSSVLVADKTGEVYSFPWPPGEQTDKVTCPAPAEGRFHGTFLLSHSSSVIGMALATMRGQRFLITGDRDEHIRVSAFPQTWVIHAMGLSHTAFVTCVVSVGDTFVSGGGDNRVIRWDCNGVVLDEYTSVRGSAVRCIRRYKDWIVVVGERLFFVSTSADLDRT
jgi:tRNA (guanine-N(7)-)-methyltransferase subunit TRM82